MTTSLHTSLQPRFRTVDGISIRYAESDDPGRGEHALLLSPWPESVYAFEATWSRLAQRSENGDVTRHREHCTHDARRRKRHRVLLPSLRRADGVPLVFLQHVTGTMDYWDPAVVDDFARARPAILVDYPGVGRSGGTTPDTVPGLAEHVVAFIGALGLTQVDLLGFSLGGFVAQAVAAEHPNLVRRVILAETGSEGGEGIQNLGNVLMQGRQENPAEPRLYLFFD